MIRRAALLVIMAGLAATTVTAPGCMIAADALNPDLFSSLGLDPNLFTADSGTVIVNFTNETGYSAVFNAFESRGGEDFSVDTRNFSVEVPANTSRNEVLDCPIGLFSTGVVDNAYALDPTAVQVVAGDTAVDVSYAWELLQGRDFSCGDVIDVTLTGTGGTATEDFSITIRVIPGR